jgi:hypothetical protein
MTRDEKIAEIRVLPLPEGIDRMESGPVQFGEDDWPGYFLRGDNAFELISGLDLVESIVKQCDDRFSVQLWVSSSLGWIRSMRSCILVDDPEPQTKEEKADEAN